jgi:hypothetical protein
VEIGKEVGCFFIGVISCKTRLTANVSRWELENILGVLFLVNKGKKSLMNYTDCFLDFMK